MGVGAKYADVTKKKRQTRLTGGICNTKTNNNFSTDEDENDDFNDDFYDFYDDTL